MATFLENLKEEGNYTRTENAALTHLSSGSCCLDLFAVIGALRSRPEQEILTLFDRAWAENADVAIKMLFYARDIRGGLGERRVFRLLLKQLAKNNPASVIKNLWAIPEFGRFDDLLPLIDVHNTKSSDNEKSDNEKSAEKSVSAEVLECINIQFAKDMAILQAEETAESTETSKISLLGKWLPSINTSSAETVRLGKIVAKSLNLSAAEYRKALTKLRAKIAIVENFLREKDYSFDYSKQPSKAMLRYRAAFLRNDESRYKAFLESVKKGETKLNTGTLYPYEIIRKILNDYNFNWTFDNFDAVKTLTADERKSLDVTWRNLPNFTNGENAIVVVDGSGSMYNMSNPRPADVALSLGIYFAERNTGVFKDCFITFSQNPRIVEVKGADIFEKAKFAASYNEVANTNIQKVFELILQTAKKHNTPQSELPTTIYIISDMEFDRCTDNANITNFEYAKKIFEKNGYKLPKLVFWNVQSRNNQQPVKMHETGTILVSGASPRIFEMLENGNFSPLSFMLETLGKERYKEIVP
ncbi:MAG: DUF2828 domain-containing protein [Defluviitaleaceae bacterium]|nr:DUF2828 domain-containing protein [Defluviitaleaceae bacterium]